MAHLAEHQRKARHRIEKGDAVAELLSVAKEFSPRISFHHIKMCAVSYLHSQCVDYSTQT